MSRKHRRSAAQRKGKPRGHRLAASARLFTQAVAAYEAGRADLAAQICQEVLRAQPEHADALHLLGVLAHERSRDDEARELLQRAVRIDGRDAMLHFNLAEVERTRGDFAAALASYDHTLGIEAGLADAHYGRGNALFELGRYGEAADAYRRALRLAPDDAELHNNLGNVLIELGDTEAAIQHYREAIQLQPGYADAHVNLGTALRGRNRHAEALRSFATAIALDPESPEPHAALAHILAERGDFQNALRHFRRAVELRPDSSQYVLDLASLLQLLERFDEAIEWFHKALAIDPQASEAHARLGACYQQMGRVEEALDEFRAALEGEPSGDVRLTVAIALENEGRFAEAVEQHRQVLADHPDFGTSYMRLALNKRGGLDDADIARMLELLERADLPVEHRMPIEFALGEAFHRRGDTERAFAHFAAANALRAQQLPFEAENFRDHIDRIIETFSPELFAATQGFGVESEVPVFIVGMPRSGSTLVEQIVSSHPAVYGAGEALHIHNLVQRLPDIVGTGEEFPECVRSLTRATSVELAEEYLQLVRRRAPEAARICDKLLGNYSRLGLIALLFPKARIIHCRRDPLDTCLSCYFQHFAHGLNFTYDLSALGVAYRGYERLMAHWREVLPLRMLEVQYEEVVADQEGQSRGLIDFLGLPWDDRCLQFHRQERDVRTASFWQVRQPVYRSSVGRWRAYEKHLGPLLEALDAEQRQHEPNLAEAIAGRFQAIGGAGDLEPHPPAPVDEPRKFEQ